MKQLIIAEKPSVARDLAKVLKVSKSGDFFENNQWIISSAVGHLVELPKPDQIDPELKSWKISTLPILPKNFKLKPIEKTKKKFQELRKLLKRSDISCVINGCDAGREGELIFTYIYELAKCKLPIKRLWMQSMTSSGIKKAFEDLRPLDDMIPLQEAARCRSEADWLIGINGTRIISKKLGFRGGQASTVGRVQTPTLGLIVKREKEIATFQAQNYWRLEGNFSLKSGTYSGIYQRNDFKKIHSHDRIDRIWEKGIAESLHTNINPAKKASVVEEKKRSRMGAPRLFDLTSLQREANGRFGLPAKKTLSIAQSLYEKHKVITYPRTDAKALPEDYPTTCRKIIGSLGSKFKSFTDPILANNWVQSGNKKIFNNKQVSDHFAIIPTEAVPTKLSPEEEKIYQLVARRFLAIFHPPAEFDITTRITSIDIHNFKTEGKVLVSPGWMTVTGRATGDKGELPPLTKEDGEPPLAKIDDIILHAEETKPPPRYTEATLLGSMETAGRLVEDENYAEAMKERGLGTPATRAQIIEHLIYEKYLVRDLRELIPTAKADELIQFLGTVNVEELASPDLTGDWEFKLHQIEQGALTRRDFMKGIHKMTKDIINKSKTFNEEKIRFGTTKVIAPSDGKPFYETLRYYRSEDGVYNIGKILGGRKLPENELENLLKNRQIGPFDNFRSKAGKNFSAMLKINEENRVEFVFEKSSDDQDEKIDLSKFPKIEGVFWPDGSSIIETPTAYVSENYYRDAEKSPFRIGRTLLGRSLPIEQIKKLCKEGKTDLLDKFRSNKTKRLFSAHLTLDEKGKIGFEFAERKVKK